MQQEDTNQFVFEKFKEYYALSITNNDVKPAC